MNVCRFSASIWYISHLLIIHVEWAKISWLSYRHVCRTLISQTFCKWGYYAINKAEWTSAVWREREERGALIRTPVIFKQGSIMAPREGISHLLHSASVFSLQEEWRPCDCWNLPFVISESRRLLFTPGSAGAAPPGFHFRWEEVNN